MAAQARNGVIATVNRDVVTVLYFTGANLSTSYFKIRAFKAAAELWEITFTNDFENIYGGNQS